MAEFIQACKNLLTSTLPTEYSFTIVNENPEAILQCEDIKMALWAQSLSGSKTLFMRSPSLTRELEKLADLGEGRALTLDRIKYKFVQSVFPS